MDPSNAAIARLKKAGVGRDETTTAAEALLLDDDNNGTYNNDTYNHRFDYNNDT